MVVKSIKLGRDIVDIFAQEVASITDPSTWSPDIVVGVYVRLTKWETVPSSLLILFYTIIRYLHVIAVSRKVECLIINWRSSGWETGTQVNQGRRASNDNHYIIDCSNNAFRYKSFNLYNDLTQGRPYGGEKYAVWIIHVYVDLGRDPVSDFVSDGSETGTQPPELSTWSKQVNRPACYIAVFKIITVYGNRDESNECKSGNFANTWLDCHRQCTYVYMLL